MAKKVYVGIGHGGRDSGACANGFKEKNLNLYVGNACTALLKKAGVEVKQSRTVDKDVYINTKVREANNWGADLVLDIHHNAGGGDGCEVYYSRVGGTSKTLAQNILNEICKQGQQSRGIKTKLGSSGRDYFGMPDKSGTNGAIASKDDEFAIPMGFHDGSGKVSIAADEKAKLIEANIKSGIEILGVTGSYGGEEIKAQSNKDVTPAATAQQITPDEGFDYLSQVTVKAIPYAESENSAGGITVTIG